MTPSAHAERVEARQIEPSHRYPGITWAAIAAELAREAAARDRTYPALIDKGRMTPAEADYQRAVLAAIAADLEVMIAADPPDAVDHPYSWLQRREALGRELDQRARFYPQWIAAARLTEADAARRVACLECLLAVYDEGWGWRPLRAYPPLARQSACDAREWSAEWDAAWRSTRTCARLEGARQQDLAL